MSTARSNTVSPNTLQGRLNTGEWRGKLLGKSVNAQKNLQSSSAFGFLFPNTALPSLGSWSAYILTGTINLGVRDRSCSGLVLGARGLSRWPGTAASKMLAGCLFISLGALQSCKHNVKFVQNKQTKSHGSIKNKIYGSAYTDAHIPGPGTK